MKKIQLSFSWLKVLTGFFLVLCFTAMPVFASSPLAVLKSEQNQAAYVDEHIGDFDDDFASFKRTIETANVRYDELSDADVLGGLSKLANYKVIIVPLLLDLPPRVVSVLKGFVGAGGKLIITDGSGSPSQSAQELISCCGAQVTGHSTMQETHQLYWQRTPLPFYQDFAVGTLRALLALTEPVSSGNTASWLDSSNKLAGIAIACHNGNAYLSWAPGLQGDLSANAQILSLVLEEASCGITQQAAVQISYAEYQTIQQELDYLVKRTDEIIKTAKQADLAVPFESIQENYNLALSCIEKFQEAYKERRFYEASEQVSKARQELSLAFAKAMPVRPVEARSVWLDRGTIIATKNEQGMIALIDKLKAAGINSIYFETNNAGFTMYPSQVAVQNPQLNGWDAFGTACSEAHKQGMEFHAWIWVFNVGNERHNPIIEKEIDYPGPVLSTKRFGWALAGKTGSLFAHNQHEYWLDPAHFQARKYIKDLLAELVRKYPIDGIQYDYIRYPFNGKPNQMGFDWEGRIRFERETGLCVDKLDEEASSVWQAWRIAQVNSFVEETSNMLRSINPDIRISAAVYGTPRRLRCWNIQQEWEVWIQKGWIDTVNPMTYVGTAKELQIMAANVRESSEDKALVFPGLSIRQLDTAGFIEQLDTSRSVGTLGTTLFAVAQLDDKKLNLLKIGPYRKQAVMTPQADPLKAVTLLVDDFVATVKKYLDDPKKRVIADTASTNEVIKEIISVQRSVHNLKPGATHEEMEILKASVLNLHHLVKEWLRIDAFAQRGFRAQYIISYLGQIEAVLTYASHKNLTQVPAMASCLEAGH